MVSSFTDRFDGAQFSQAIKSPCVVISTSNLTLSGEQTVNSVAVVEGDRALVNGQTDQTENGIYVVETGEWVRAPDFDGARDIVDGTLVTVKKTTGMNFFYQLDGTNPILIGTSNIVFLAANDPNVSYPIIQREIDNSLTVDDINDSYEVDTALRHGAAGDGAASDVVAVQQMFTALGSAHGKATFNPGYTFYIPSTVSFDIDQLTVIADGAKLTSNTDGIMFELNSGSDLTDITSMNNTLNREVRWFGGHFVNTNATKTASVALNGTLFRQIIIEPEVIEGFWKGCNLAGRDTMRFNNGRYYNNIFSIYIPADLMGTHSQHLGLTLDGVHFSGGSILETFCVIRGSVSNIDIGRGSFNFGGVNNATGVLIDNVSAFETNTDYTIGGYWENVVTGCKCIYFKNSNATYQFLNIDIDNNHFNTNATGHICVDMENCRNVRYGVNRFRQTATSTSPVNFDDNCLDIEFSRGNWFSALWPTYDTATKRSEVTFLPEIRPQTGANNVANYDGDSFSTTTATIDMSSAISAIFPPEGNPTGYMIGVQAMDSGSAAAAAGACRLRFAKTSAIGAANTNDAKLLDLAGTPNDNRVGGSFYVPADENGDIYIDIAATGASTMDIWLTVDAVYM